MVDGTVVVELIGFCTAAQIAVTVIVGPGHQAWPLAIQPVREGVGPLSFKCASFASLTVAPPPIT